MTAASVQSEIAIQWLLLAQCIRKLQLAQAVSILFVKITGNRADYVLGVAGKNMDTTLRGNNGRRYVPLTKKGAKVKRKMQTFGIMAETVTRR